MPSKAKPIQTSFTYVVIVLTTTLLIGAAAWACDTPVYRYAMYNWTAESYVVVYAYEGEPDPVDDSANEVLANAGTEDHPANVRFLSIDVSHPDDVQQLPREMQMAIGQGSDAQPPYHCVFSPHSRLLLQERLDETTAQQLIESPARQTLTELLKTGSAGVLVLLECENPEANAMALQEAEAAIARAAAGEIQPFTLAGAEVDGEEVEPFEVGLIVVSRDDPEEQALVNMLLDVEDDLREFTEPMIFGVYGRGRAGWPYLGKGITKENMDDALAFMSGACSCEVKEQNPGMDLLVSADWNAAAEFLAVQFQDESADEYLKAEAMFPAVINTLETQDQPDNELPNEDDRLAAADQVELDSPATVSSTRTLEPAPSPEKADVPQQPTADLNTQPASPITNGLYLVLGGMLMVAVLSTLVLLRLRA